ncbi:MAG: hypothetical protein SPJ86_01470 [Eubacteriales bacterium]|nr:hypothetical protein [Eubacteriales bacterium]
MEDCTVPKPKLIRTPVHKIPIGEAVKKPDGHYSLRIKKPKGSEYEELSLDRFISMVVAEAETQYGTEQVPRSEGAAAENKS